MVINSYGVGSPPPTTTTSPRLPVLSSLHLDVARGKFKNNAAGRGIRGTESEGATLNIALKHTERKQSPGPEPGR